MTTFETLLYAVDDGILTLTLNRPDQLNAFTVQMAADLERAFTEANADDDIRAIVVTGAGRAFCAGMDLTTDGNVFGLDETQHPTPQDMADRFDDPDFVDGVRDAGGQVTLAIHACTKPVIAAVNGPAVGIGATMICAMDARLASENASIGFVFGRIGIVPEACSSWFLPRIVGIPQALEWFYGADILTAEEARDGGLIRSVHAPDDLLPTAHALADKFTRNRSPVATALTRQLVWRNSAQPHPLAAHKVDSLAIWWTSVGDGKEGVAAFLQKRQPNFTSKASELPDVFGP